VTIGVPTCHVEAGDSAPCNDEPTAATAATMTVDNVNEDLVVRFMVSLVSG
jgi:hypothetical protein